MNFKQWWKSEYEEMRRKYPKWYAWFMFRIVANIFPIRCAAENGWQAALKSVVPVQQTTNSDCTAALEKEITSFYDDIKASYGYDFITRLAARLNSVVKAQQNCV